MNMGIEVRFRGQSGKAWQFQRVATEAPWARTAGVAIFAAPDTYGWRIIRVVELSGRPNDVQPIWALADAERYGANAVFVALEFDATARKAMAADIEEGFSPVCFSGHNRADAAPIAA
ncbi:MAG: hypothetical protein CMF04_15095 [Hyphomonas sp.]|nr:hypothetical protein [Hyphomonas sp.]|tara:strand:- start:5014 stop:5367 length:354 start_codon:yes stop_codon:yes gene_type:complete